MGVRQPWRTAHGAVALFRAPPHDRP